MNSILGLCDNVFGVPIVFVKFHMRYHNKTATQSIDLPHVSDAFAIYIVNREATAHAVVLLHMWWWICEYMEVIFWTLDSLTMDNLKLYLNKGMT